MFKIASVYRHNEELITVKVTLSAKEWFKAKNQGQLGQLYGVDISNAVYREYGVKAIYPIVGDRDRAKNGIKLIKLTYHDKEWQEPIDNVIRVDFQSRRRVA